MKYFYSTLFLLCIVLFNTNIQANSALITDDNISEITERLDNLSTVELVERRNLILKSLEEEDDSNSPIVLGSRPQRLLELSIIEQLLILAGVILVENITEDSTTPPDTVSPVITVLGDNPAIVELGDAYVDAGATADTGESVVTIGNVDTNTVGTYIITYTATDSAGNIGTATRTVNVVDTIAPVVTLIGAATVTVELGDTYTELGAIANDATGTVTVVTTGTVDTDTIGSYIVTYTSTDASGNVGIISRTVNVVDTTAPTINSPSTFTVVENQTSIGTVEVSDAGDVSFSVTGSDIIVIDQNGVLSFITAPDFESQTSYTIVVTVTDASGNTVSQEITINITNDPDDDDDDTGTGTGTGTGTSTGTGTGTGTGTS
mgnify:CR=1 FL=1|tara:strand:- start:601 stop:1731 length:1131 start_codon:yes stop_codon:yes gene_type:complete